MKTHQSNGAERMFAIFERLINFVLNLDPEKDELLPRLQQNALCITLTDMQTSVWLYPDADRILLRQRPPESYKIHHLRARSGSLVAMAMSAVPQSFIQNKTVAFEGELQALQQYHAFFKALKPDILFHISQKTRLPIAHILQKPYDGIVSWLNQHHSVARVELTEYLQEESRLFPPKEEVEDFFDEIQQLKVDCDRIHAKLKKLTALGNTTKGASSA